MEKQYKVIGAKQPKPPVFKQMFLCVTASVYCVLTGMSFGSPTVVVPQLRKEANSTEAVSEEMASWITSIVSFSAMPWTCILIITGHYIGRKKPWHMTSVISFIAYTILYYSKNIMYVFISQMILGITLGTQLGLSVMILTESASPRYRGLFLAIKSASFFWGIWVANAIGAFLNFRYIGLIGMVFSIYNFVTVFFIPETPYWLAYKGRYDECAKAHRWLKGVDEDAEKELDNLIMSQEVNRKSTRKNKTILILCKNYVNLVKQREFYKPVSIALLVVITYHMSGKLIYAVYAVEMLNKITKSHAIAYNGMLILDGFSILGMYIGCGLVKFLKRRTILLISSVIALLLTYGMSLNLYLVKLKIIPENNYVALSFLIMFSLVICGGPLILSSAIPGELCPIKSRSFAAFVLTITANLTLGLSLKVAPYCFKAFDFHGTFLLFGIAFTICIVLVYKFLPETKDKTLTEISAIFEKKENIQSLE